MKPLFLLFLLFVVKTKSFSQHEGYVQIPDGKMYYHTFGTGRPLLIINGGPGMNSEGFTDLAKTLSLKSTAILFDQRGTGKSTLNKINSSTITLKKMAEDIEVLRKELKIDRWTVLGHSFGGMLASYYATLYPKHINALILSSSGGIDLELQGYISKNINKRLTSIQLDSLQYWNGRIEGGDTSHATRLQRGRNLAPGYVFNKRFEPAIAERLTQGNNEINALVWQDLRLINFNCRDKLLSFTNPVLIIQGKQDIIEEKTAEKAHKTFKNSKVVLMDNCVHYGWLDRPDQYFGEIEKFLRTVE